MTNGRRRCRWHPPIAERRDHRTPLYTFAAALALTALLTSTPSVHAACVAPSGAPACDAPPDPSSSPVPDTLGRHVANPVDVVSGNKYQASVDYRSPDSPLAFVRHYNSALADHDIGLGRGWRHSYAATLTRERDGTYLVVQGDGRLIAFAADGRTDDSGTVRHAARNPADGFLVAGERHVWHLTDGRELTFQGSFLVAIAYPDGQRLRLRYRQRRLESVADDRGRVLRLVHAPGASGLGRYGDDAAPPGHVERLVLPNGAAVRYRYDARLNLVGADDASGVGERYRYGDPAWPNHLTALDATDGAPRGRWGYDAAGRAVRWRAGDGPGAVRIDYLDDARSATAGRTEVVRTSGSVEAFDWTTSDDGLEQRVVRRRSLPRTDPPARSWSGMKPVGSARTKPDPDYAELTLDTLLDLPPTESVAADVPMDDGSRVPVVLHVDRFGNTRDAQIGATRLTNIARAVRANPERHRRVREALRGRAEETEPLAVRADRLARRSAGASTVTPRMRWEDLETFDELLPRAEEVARRGARGGLQPRGKQFGTGQTCPLPKHTDCDDVRESRVMAELSACAYPGQSCGTALRVVSPASVGMDATDFIVGDVPSTLYFDPARNRYTLAFRGTENGQDWYENIRNGVGVSSDQYSKAARLAEVLEVRVRRRFPNAELTFTGHSLGGGLATIAAVSTEREATVFNSAGLHHGTARWNGVSLDDAGYLVQNVRVIGDPVSKGQRASGILNALADAVLPGSQTPLLPDQAPGYHTEIPKPEQSWIDARAASGYDGVGAESLILHSIDAVRRSLDLLIDTHCKAIP